MLTTTLSPEAARRLRQGVPWVFREEIVSMEGTPPPGEPVELVDPDGNRLGVGDLDLSSHVAIRRLGLPEERPEGLLQRQLRRALERRVQLVDDPRYCRLVNDDGDGLPGLVIDRFGDHFVVQTFSRPMDARVEEIARALVDSVAAVSILLRNDRPKRADLGLAVGRPHVLYGAPPRWARVMELGARFIADIQYGLNTGYFYDQREVRRFISRVAQGARVLDPCCFTGANFIHAGLRGAKQIVAFDSDPDAVELARENAEANGLLSRAWIEEADAFDALRRLDDSFDLVLFESPDLTRLDRDPETAFLELARLCVRSTRHGGRLVVSAYQPPLRVGSLDELLARACEAEGRMAFRLARPQLPPDFPTAIGNPEAEYLSALALEIV